MVQITSADGDCMTVVGVLGLEATVGPGGRHTPQARANCSGEV